MVRSTFVLFSLILAACGGAPTSADPAPLVAHTVADYDALPAAGGVVEGKGDALVTVHSFIDLASPEFATFYAEFRRLSAANDGELRLVIRPSVDPTDAGYDAFIALSAAAMQDKLPETFAALWSWHKAWATGGAIALVASLSDEIGLDRAAFRVAIDDGSALELVNQQMMGTLESGLDGSLAFNGRPYYDMIEPTPLEGALGATLSGARELVDSGVHRNDVFARHAAANADEQAFGRPLADSELIPIGRSPTFGNRAGDIKVVAFMDFQCPYSAKAAATLAELLATNRDAELVFKHLPLEFHKQARDAAAVSVAAAAQGRFWEMSEQLFLNQRRLSSENLDELFAELGTKAQLDVPRLMKDIEAAYAVVDADLALAKKLGARATPSFFINGKMVKGAQSIEAFQAVVDEQRKLVAELDVPRSKTYAESVTRSYAKPSAAPDRRPATPPEYAAVPIGATDPVRGAKKDHLVTIVEFAEYQCPFCQRVEPTVTQLMAGNADVRLVFKHRPLPFHKSAKPAAAAAVAAGKQGKYWEMHAKLFETRLPDASEIDGHTEKIARELGLKMKKFKADRAAADAKIDADDKLALTVGARGTPTFFLNGRRLTGAQPLSNFEEALEQEREFAKTVKNDTKLSGEALYNEVLKRRIAQMDAAKVDGDGLD